MTRVGATRSLPVEARVVAATNRDLAAEVGAGRFREDLYYRINVHQIEVPPLRERRSDVPEIAERFVAAICERFGIRPSGWRRTRSICSWGTTGPGTTCASFGTWWSG